MEAIIFVGIQGVGKSTFYRERFFNMHIRINMDMLKTRHREQIILQACLEGKQAFVVDNTNPTVEERKRYIIPAKAKKFLFSNRHLQKRRKDVPLERLYKGLGQRIINFGRCLLSKYKRICQAIESGSTPSVLNLWANISARC